MKHFLVILAVSSVFSCTNNKFKIEAVDKDLNSSLITLKGLDARLFSSKEKLQYFEISGYSELKAVNLKNKLTVFITKNYNLDEISKADEFTFMFYKKSPFVNYRKYVYEAARDTERGIIEEYKDNLVAQVWFTKSADGKSIRHATIYDKEVQLLNEADTIEIKSTSTKNTASSAVKQLAIVENNNCLSINSKTDKLSFKNCYEVDFVRINTATEIHLSLTFISGKNAMDIDFYPKGNDWLSKEVTFFGATSKNSKGLTLKMEISLKEFNFGTIAQSFLSQE